MKKVMHSVLYAALLLIELLVGSTLMLLLWFNTLHQACMVTVLVWAVMVVWQVILLIKVTDKAKRHKIKRNISLVMMIPTVAFIGMVIWFIVKFRLLT